MTADIALMCPAVEASTTLKRPAGSLPEESPKRQRTTSDADPSPPTNTAEAVAAPPPTVADGDVASSAPAPFVPPNGAAGGVAGDDDFYDLQVVTGWAPPLAGTVTHLNNMWGFVRCGRQELCFHLNDLHGLRRCVAPGDKIHYRTRPVKPDVAFDVTPDPPYPVDADEVAALCDELRKARPSPGPMLLHLAGNVGALQGFLAALPEATPEPPKTAVLAVTSLLLYCGGRALLDNCLHQDLVGRFLLALLRPPTPAARSFLAKAAGYLERMDHSKEPLKSASLLASAGRLLGYLRRLCPAVSEPGQADVARFREVVAAIAARHGFDVPRPPELLNPLPRFPSCLDLRVGPDNARSALNPHSGLRKIAPEGPYPNVSEYVRTQFDLLKADCFTSFTRSVAKEFFNVECPYESERVAPCTYYTHVELVGEAIKQQSYELCHLLAFRPPREEELQERKMTERLTGGKLLCITTDKFENELWWAVVEVRHPDLIKAGVVGVQFLQGNPKGLLRCARRNQLAKRSAESIMVEADIFFHNQKAVLQSLDQLHQNSDVPLKEVLVDVKRTATVPSYRYLRDGYEYVNMLDTMCSQTRFDPTQEAAFRALATHKVLLVQGPPGTGKSFIGGKLAEAVTTLRRDKRKVSPLPFRPILVIAFKNRSLDEFLCDCLGFTNDVVRVGAQSRTAALEPYNLRAKVSTTKERRVLRFRLLDRLGQLVQLAKEIRALRLTPEVVVPLLEQEQGRKWGKEITPELLEAWYSGSPFVYSVLDGLPSRGLGGADLREEEEEDEDTPARLDAAELQKELRNEQAEHRAKEFLRLTAVPLNSAGLLQRARGIPELNRLDIVQRQLVAQAWLCTANAALFERYNNLKYEVELLSLACRTARDESKLAALQSADIVGMTTSGCVMNQRLTEQLQPSVLIVEEAAEILESHLLCCLTKSVHQVILIGDHKQLQPSVEVHRLAEHCNLSLSLFERLCNNDFAPFMLGTQRRMDAAIAALVSPIYGGLETSPIVYQRRLSTTFGPSQHVPGLSTHVFFWTHNEAEEGFKGSQWNPQEVHMATSLAKYLLANGLRPTQVTAVTPYVGQLRALRAAVTEQGLDIDVQTVDTFQGGENDVIILSLVRTQKLTDFLRRQNRMCVALSRARFGLYILGSPGILRTPECQHWDRTMNLLDARTPSAIGPALPLQCRLHPDATAAADAYAEFPHHFCPHCPPSPAP
eukprot:EG_transcript_393